MSNPNNRPYACQICSWELSIEGRKREAIEHGPTTSVVVSALFKHAIGHAFPGEELEKMVDIFADAIWEKP